MDSATNHVADGATKRARWLVVLLFLAVFALLIGGWVTWKFAQPSAWDHAEDGRLVGVSLASIDRWYRESPSNYPRVPGFDRTYWQEGYMDYGFALGIQAEDGRVVGCAIMMVGTKSISRKTISVQKQFGRVPVVPPVMP